MIILSNCLGTKKDEGFFKLADSLVGRIRERSKKAFVVTYDRESEISDKHLKINGLMLSRTLMKLLKERREPLLYLPAPASMKLTALRVFILSLFARRGLRVILPTGRPSGFVEKMLIRMSRAQVVCLSKSAWQSWQAVISTRAEYLKTGVDIEKYAPVTEQEKAELRDKYSVPQNKPVVLHIGALCEENNADKLLNIDNRYHIVLAMGEQTESEREVQLRQRLMKRGGITMLDNLSCDIRELYQLSDIFFFPITEYDRCIEVPLCVLEAAACGAAVASTPFGEIEELLGKSGFYRLDAFDVISVNNLLDKITAEEKNPRRSVLRYDWNDAVEKILKVYP
jgi:glycosyltransferase involved in cell wall biosynthesis